MSQQAILNNDLMASLADQIVARINAGPAIETITFGELFHQYYERHVKIRLRNTANAFYFFKAHGGPRWSSVRIHEMKRTDLQNWVDEIAKSSRSAATRALNMMKAIINWGIRRDILPPIANPCNGVETFVIKSRKRFLVSAEIVRLKAALDEESDLFRDFFWICLLTGARKNNVLTMRFDELDLDLATWTIPPSKFKNGDEHTIPLCKMATFILARRLLDVSDRSAWVFPGMKPGSHLQEPKRAWKRIITRAGISDVHIHDLRRTLASWMAIDGKSQYVIAQMLGHTDMRSTAVYARLDLTAVREAAGAVSEKWEKLLTHKAAPRLETVKPVKAQFNNSDVQITGTDQIIVEAKILTVLRAGGGTKKDFYRKIGSQFQVNSREMDRILRCMEERDLIVSKVEQGAHHVFRRYALKSASA